MLICNCFPVSDALEQLRDNVDELENVGAESRDLDFLKQLLEDPSLLKVVEVSFETLLFYIICDSSLGSNTVGVKLAISCRALCGNL